MRRIAVAAHAEKDADEPRPAPTGSVARVLKSNAGLFFVRYNKSSREYGRDKGIRKASC